jgi:hypothetical protein
MLLKKSEVCAVVRKEYLCSMTPEFPGRLCAVDKAAEQWSIEHQLIEERYRDSNM